MANIQTQRFGVREICNVVFKAKAPMKIGNTTFQKGQPVLYMDTAKTSTLEGAATTVYATGGRGNARLIAWEGERTLTFTVEDALLSPISFAMLSGAGLLGGESTKELVHVHTTSYAVVSKADSVATIDLADALAANEQVCPDAPLFIMKTAADGAIYGSVLTCVESNETHGYTYTAATETPKAKEKKVLTLDAASSALVDNGDTVFVDYYIVKPEKNVTELQIDAEKFGGYFYVEADTLYRFQEDGQDYPAVITLPNVKIQSNFTFSMAASGDPSTFTFTMDAFPGYTYFNKTRKVLCVIQVVDAAGEIKDIESVMRHGNSVKITNDKDEAMEDSLPKDFVDNSAMGSTAAPYVTWANSKDDTTNP